MTDPLRSLVAGSIPALQSIEREEKQGLQLRRRARHCKQVEALPLR